MIKPLYPGNLNGHDERGGGSTCLGPGGEREFLAVVGDDQAQEKDGDDVEEEDSQECEADGLWHAQSWVLGLADGDAYKFSAGEGVHRGNHRAPQAKQFPLGAVDLVLREGPRLRPVSEPRAVSGRPTADREYEQEDYNADHDEHLQRRQPELELPKGLDADAIYDENQD